MRGEKKAPEEHNLPPHMVSYTPNFEDVLLRRCFPNVKDGFYVDIGAFDPTLSSVTKWFYDNGWTGVNVEPGPIFEEIERSRPRDINIRAAVTDHVGEEEFFLHTANPGTSSLSRKMPSIVAEKAGEVSTIRVGTISLTHLFENHVSGRHVHFLKIDAEGAESAIITGYDWEGNRPEVLVIESTEPYTNIRREEPWQEILTKARYHFAYFDGVNDFWVREESQPLLESFKLPVNVLDQFYCVDPRVSLLEAEVRQLRRSLEQSVRINKGEPSDDSPNLRRVLFCTMMPPDLINGATLVCQHHLKAISDAGYEIHLATQVSSHEDEFVQFVDSLNRVVVHPFFFLSGPTAPRKTLAWKYAFLHERGANERSDIDSDLLRLAKSVNPDVIIFEFLYTALFFPSAFSLETPVVTITQNNETNFYREKRKVSWDWDASNSEIANWRLARFERNVYLASDGVITLTSNDLPKDIARSRHCCVCEPMLEVKDRTWQHPDSPSVFFVGNVAHYPNLLAVRWLCYEFAPHLLRTCREASLVIIGAGYDAFPDIQDRQNIQLLGTSSREEVEARFRNSSLLIAPIENSSGSKLKTVESFSFRTPLVATDAALSGFSASSVPRIHLDDPEGAAKLVGELLRSPSQLKELSAEQARDYDLALDENANHWREFLEAMTSCRPTRNRAEMKRQIKARNRLKQRAPATRRIRVTKSVEIGLHSVDGVSYFGFYAAEATKEGPLRWVSGDARMEVAIDISRPPKAVSVSLWGIALPGAEEVVIRVDGRERARAKISEKGYLGEFGLSELHRSGLLKIEIISQGFSVEGDARELGVAVRSITLR